MLEEIITRFCHESKFINDFDGLCKYLDSLNLTMSGKSEILEEVFSYNSKMYSLIVEENKKLEKIITRVNTTKERKDIPIFENDEIKREQKLDVINLDVRLELIRIKQCENLGELETILSSNKTNTTVIILKLVEEIFDIKKMLYQERHNIDSDTKMFFENEIEKLKIKVEYLKQIVNKNQKKNVQVKDEIENHMLFLKTNYGNVCAYSDLKDIPVDYYDTFYGLLESIHTGNFKNLKILAGDGPLKGLSEVKDNQGRVVFDCINKNNYVILAMFVKKVDTDAGYRAYLINRKELYENSKDIILNSQSNLEYLEENRRIKDKIYSILKKDNKVKKKG